LPVLARLPHAATINRKIETSISQTHAGQPGENGIAAALPSFRDLGDPPSRLLDGRWERELLTTTDATGLGSASLPSEWTSHTGAQPLLAGGRVSDIREVL